MLPANPSVTPTSARSAELHMHFDLDLQGIPYQKDVDAVAQGGRRGNDDRRSDVSAHGVDCDSGAV